MGIISLTKHSIRLLQDSLINKHPTENTPFVAATQIRNRIHKWRQKMMKRLNSYLILTIFREK
jgi:hypothetical protein